MIKKKKRKFSFVCSRRTRVLVSAPLLSLAIGVGLLRTLLLLRLRRSRELN